MNLSTRMNDRVLIPSQVTFFDVPLHYNFHEASKAGSQYDLRKILNESILKLRPGDAVTFVDNHE